jgi:hypothetical protein
MARRASRTRSPMTFFDSEARVLFTRALCKGNFGLRYSHEEYLNRCSEDRVADHSGGFVHVCSSASERRQVQP